MSRKLKFTLLIIMIANLLVTSNAKATTSKDSANGGSAAAVSATTETDIAANPPAGVAASSGSKYKIYLNFNDPEYQELRNLTEEQWDSSRGPDPYQSVGDILFMAEDRIADSLALSLRRSGRLNKIKSIVISGLNIETTTRKNSNVQFEKLDHRELPFSQFEERWFDAIIMRSGLCTCGNAPQDSTCGGIDVRSPEHMLGFMMEIGKMLKHENPKALAYLHGEHHDVEGDAEGDLPFNREKELKTEKAIERAIPQIEAAFPNLQVRMIYTRNSAAQAFSYNLRNGSIRTKRTLECDELKEKVLAEFRNFSPVDTKARKELLESPLAKDCGLTQDDRGTSYLQNGKLRDFIDTFKGVKITPVTSSQVPR